MLLLLLLLPAGGDAEIASVLPLQWTDKSTHRVAAFALWSGPICEAALDLLARGDITADLLFRTLFFFFRSASAGRTRSLD